MFLLLIILQVRSLTEKGNLTRAQEHSRLTSTLVYTGIAIGAFGWLLITTMSVIYRLDNGDTGTDIDVVTEKFAVYDV